MSENSTVKTPIQLSPGTITRRKRVGRGAGSGTGCTAGRGTKGQKARSGSKIRPGFEGGQMPLYRRLPRRGFSNYPFKQKPLVLSLALIDKKYEVDDVVSLQSLREKKLIRGRDKFVKILGTGNVSKVLTIDESVYVAASVRDKVLSHGGQVRSSVSHRDADKNESIASGENT